MSGKDENKDQERLQLPKQVQDQLDKAEKLEEELRKGNTEEPAKPAATPEEGEFEAKYEQMKHQYDVLRGKYNKEVPRLNQQIQESGKELEKVSAQVSELQQQLQEERSKQTEQTTESFHDAMIDGGYATNDPLVKEVEKLRKQINATATENSELKQQLSNLGQDVEVAKKTTTTTSISLFNQAVLTAHKDAEEVLGSNANFHKWLEEYEGHSGITRWQTCEEAMKRRDSDTVIRLIDAWKKESGVKNPPPNQQENLNPDISHSTVETPAGEKRTYTRKFIHDFYRDKANRTIYERMTDEEVQELDKDIVQASKEGRVEGAPQM